MCLTSFVNITSNNMCGGAIVSTLRRVRTWLRSTMSNDCLSGLCVLSVHRDKVNCNKKDFKDKIVDMFGIDNRRLQFLFKE